MSRESILIDLYEEYRSDEHPALAHLRTYTTGIKLVPGEGSVRPLVLLVGEAPGATENAKGRPFVGASGLVLRDLMGQCDLYATEWIGSGLRHDANVYITNAVKYRPPGNRTPTSDEIEASRPYLRREWKILGGPRVILTAGATALSAVLSQKLAVGKVAGKPLLLRDGKTWVYPTFHPSYALHNKRFRPELTRQWSEFHNWLLEMEAAKWSSES